MDGGPAATRQRRASGASADPKPGSLKDLQQQVNALQSRLQAAEGKQPPPAGGSGSSPGAVGGAVGDGSARAAVSGIFGLGAPASGGEAALAEARRLLGLGDGAPAPPRPGVLGSVSQERREPATTGDAGAGATSPGVDGLEDLVQRLVRAIEGRNASASRVSPEAFGLEGAAPSSLADYDAGMGPVFGGGSGLETARGLGSLGGAVGLERLLATRRRHPDVTIAANERGVREGLGVLSNEPWSVLRHARSEVLPHAGSFLTLKRIIVVLAAAIDEGRTRGALQQQAFLWHAYRVFEGDAQSSSHNLS